jgi:hypothetical protein
MRFQRKKSMDADRPNEDLQAYLNRLLFLYPFNRPKNIKRRSFEEK